MVWLAAAGAVAQSSAPGVDYAQRILRQAGITLDGLDWSLPIKYTSPPRTNRFQVGEWQFRVDEAQQDFNVSWPRSLPPKAKPARPLRTEQEAKALAIEIAQRFGWKEGVDFQVAAYQMESGSAVYLHLPDLDGFWRMDSRLELRWDPSTGHLRSLSVREVPRFNYARPLFYLPPEAAATLAHMEFERLRQIDGGGPVAPASVLAKQIQMLWARPNTGLAQVGRQVERLRGDRPTKAPFYSFADSGRSVSIHAGTGEVSFSASLQPDGTWKRLEPGAFNPPLALASMLATVGLGGAGLFWWSRRRRRAKKVRVP